MTSEAHRPEGPLWSVLVVPSLAFLMALIRFSDVEYVGAFPALFKLLNTFILLPVTFFMVGLWAKEFHRRGSPHLLLLGGSTLIWGLCSTLSTLYPGTPNFNVTVYNLGAWCFALCQPAGAFLWGRPLSSQVARRLWLVLGGLASMAITALLVVATAKDWLPPFFLLGTGGTSIRLAILLTGASSLLLTARLLWVRGRADETRFSHWYALGLAITGLSFLAAMLTPVYGGLMNWVTRLASYLGACYLGAGVVAHSRATGQWTVPLQEVLSTGPAETGDLLTSLRDSSSGLWYLRYGMAAALTLAAFGAYQGLRAWVGPGIPPYLTFYPALMLASILVGSGPGLLTTLLALWLVETWILMPIPGGTVHAPVDRVGQVVFLLAGTLISGFSERYWRARRKTELDARHLALKKTRQEKEFLASVLRHASQPFAVVHPDGRLHLVNRAFLQLTEYLDEDVRGLSLFDILSPPDWREATQRELAGLLDRGGSVQFETEWITRTGKRIFVELIIHLMKDASGQAEHLFAFISDISRRKEEEAALKGILNSVQEPIGLFASDGTILATNQRAAQLLGREVGELLGNPLSNYLDKELASERLVRLEEVLSTRRPVQYEEDIDGMCFEHSVYPVLEADGSAHRVATFSRDITVRRRAEQALARTNQRIELLSESASGLLAAEDPQTCVDTLCRKVMTFLDCQVFFHFLVEDGEECMRLNACAGILAEEAARIEWLPFGVAVCGCAARDASPIVAEEIQTTPDPRTELVKSYGVSAYACHPLMAQGEVLGTLSFGTTNRPRFQEEELTLMRSVSDLVALAMQQVRARASLRQANAELVASNLLLEKRVEQRTRELNERLLQLQALAGQLNRAEENERQRIAQVIHDNLQQLMVSARFRVEGLDSSLDDPAVKERLQGISELLRETIAVSRSLTSELHPTVLQQKGLAAALEWLATWFLDKHGLTIRLDLDHDTEVSGTELRTMLFRGVRELLFNVVKHARVQTAEVRLRRGNRGAVLIEVRDEGTGFDPAVIRAWGGNEGGFGLFSLRERMELMGGRLEVEQASGGGSRFTLTSPEQPFLATLPTDGHGAMLPPPAGREPFTGTAPIRVLLVDDHLVVREGLGQMLAGVDYLEIVGKAANGLEALEAVRRLVPEVVMMDVSMPVMNGIEATRLIVAEFPRVRIIGLSMYSDDSHADLMHKAGAVAFLEKNSSMEVMLATIREHGGPVADSRPG